MLFFEHKALYRRCAGPRRPPGSRDAARPGAHRPRPGADATVVTYGSGVGIALAAAERMRRRRRDRRPAHGLAARRGACSRSVERPRRRARAAGGGALDRRRRPVLSARRPRGLRAARRAARAARPAGHARAVRARARGRLPAVRRLDACARWRGSLPTEPCLPTLASVGRDGRLALFRLVLLQRLVRGAAWRSTAGPDPRLRLHRPRAGGRRGGGGARARPGRRRRPAQPRARLPLRARRDGRRRVPQLPRPGDGPTRGRDGNMHFGVPERTSSRSSRCSAISSRSTVGAALAFKRRGEPRVALTFLGEGAFSVGDTHEGLNLAGVWQRAGRLRDPVQPLVLLDAGRAADGEHRTSPSAIRGGWSIPAERVDGTDALAVSRRCAPRSSARGPATGRRRSRR